MRLYDSKKIIDFRIDANTYKKDYLRTEELLQTKYCKTIDDLSISVQNFGAYSLCNLIEFKTEGIPFLMTENIRSNFINWNIQKYIDERTHEILYKSHCNKGQVLLTMAGEYLGRAAVYNKEFVSSSNQAIAKITLKKDINSYWISTFLNTNYGQNQINRLKTITGQPNINMTLIKSLKIFIPDKILQEKIQYIIELSESLNNKSKSLYTQAEQSLLEELGLVDWQPSTEKSNTKSFKESFISTGRLDAEYYQPKYQDYLNLIKEYKHGHGLLFEICKLKDKNFIPEPNIKYKYVELANIGKNGDILDCTLNHGENLPSRARRLIKKGDVLISSIEGSLNSCALVTEGFDSSICSTGFYVINSEKINSETLLILFKSDLIQNILKQNCSGTILTAINKDEFKNITIPIIEINIQNKISGLVQESFKLKQQSENLLEMAKRAVEIAIEQDEATAIRYINEIVKEDVFMQKEK